MTLPTAPCLGDRFQPERNAFGPLRLLFASLVLCSHAWPLSGLGMLDSLALATGGQIALGELGVDGFFILSGFLIAKSAEGAPSVWRFLWKRGLRILPGYWSCLVLMALGFAPLWRALEGGGDWPGALRGGLQFARANFALHILQERIPGLLESVPYVPRINGSLWTLEYEAVCYLGVALLLWLSLFSTRRRGLAALLLAVFWAGHALESGQSGLGVALLGGLASPTLLRLGTFFLAGAAAHLYRDSIPCEPRLFAASAAALCAAAAAGSGFQAIAPAALGYAVLWLGVELPTGDFARKRDLSYGLYLFAFPVQQTLALLGVHQRGLPSFIAASLALTLPLAALSFSLVEAPALRLKQLGRGKEAALSS